MDNDQQSKATEPTGDQRGPMPSHTPGPWTVYINDYAWRFDIADAATHKYLVAQTASDSELDQHNAVLIAAAPDMLAALKATEQSWLEKVPAGPGPDEFPNWHRVRAAIAKAEGK
jgi:hypothetical protein